MRFLGRSLMGLFLLAATIALLATAVLTVTSAMKARADREGARPGGEERVFSANVATITPGRVVPVLSVNGEVSARRGLDIRTLAGGTVVEMADTFETGGKVLQGDLLLRIDPLDFQRAVELAQTDLTQAEAELRDARAARDLARDDLANAHRQSDLREAALLRQKDLQSRGVGTEAAAENAALAAASAEQAVLSKRQAVISADARIATAQATLTRRRVGLEEATRRLTETEIRAGLSGTLEDVSVVQGGIVTANEKLARIIDPTSLEVSFRVSTAQHARLIGPDGALGAQPVSVRLAANGVDLTVAGKIAREGASVGDGQTGRQIFATLDPAPKLRPGDFVTVDIAEPALEQAVLLPASALGADNSVLILGEGNRLEAAPATLLRRQGDDVILRLDGMAGREVVLERTPTLGAGIKLRPLRKGADGKPVPEAPETVTLNTDQQSALLAFLSANDRMPEDRKAKLMEEVKAGELPAETFARLQARMGQ